MGGVLYFSVENSKCHKIGTGLLPWLCTPFWASLEIKKWSAGSSSTDVLVIIIEGEGSDRFTFETGKIVRNIFWNFKRNIEICYSEVTKKILKSFHHSWRKNLYLPKCSALISAGQYSKISVFRIFVNWENLKVHSETNIQKSWSLIYRSVGKKLMS